MATQTTSSRADAGSGRGPARDVRWEVAADEPGPRSDEPRSASRR